MFNFIRELLETQILLESREILDRHSNYGYWIDTTDRELVPAEKPYSHYYLLLNHFMPKWGIDKGTEELDEYDAFDRGLVRVVHQPKDQLQVQGYEDNVKHVANIILATALQNDISVVVLDFLDEAGGGNVYQMPQDKQRLISNLRS